MESEAEDGIADEAYNHLLCSFCQCFGSPIKICTDGRIICEECERYEKGRDFTLNLIEVPAFETFLKAHIFDCTYKENGCEEILPYNLVVEHESKCLFRTEKCMVKGCDWWDSLIGLHKHFHIKHNSYIHFNDIQFTKFEEEKIDDLIFTVIQDEIFMIEFNYEPGSDIKFLISYVSSYIKVAEYTIYDGSKIIKQGRCESFSFDNCYEVLEIKLIKDIHNCILTLKITPQRYNSHIVDYSLIDNHRCLKCMGYLIPYPYDLQPFGNVCGNCVGKDSTVGTTPRPISDDLKKANFPCRWKFCSVVARSSKMHSHEATCLYRLQECLIDKRCDSMDLADMKHHLKTVHCITYFKDKYVMKKPVKKCIFTVKNRAFLLVTVNVLDEWTIHVTLKSSARCRAPIYVQCEHDHCDIKSRLFCVINEIRLTREYLPLCYKQYKAFSITFDKTS